MQTHHPRDHFLRNTTSLPPPPPPASSSRPAGCPPCGGSMRPSHPPQTSMPPPKITTVAPTVENYIGPNCSKNCLMNPDSADIQQLGEPMSPCMNCTSIYMAMRDRSPFDRAYLRAYNKLPGMYVTNLDSLVFAP